MILGFSIILRARTTSIAIPIEVDVLSCPAYSYTDKNEIIDIVFVIGLLVSVIHFICFYFIHNLQELAHAQMLHAKAHWPTAVSTCLWPYFIYRANDSINVTPLCGEKMSPIKKFTFSHIKPNFTQMQPIGIPCYVLHD